MSEPTTVTPPSAHEVENQKFLKQLIGACEDRGQRAALRRYWSPATRHDAFAVMGRLRAIGNDVFSPRAIIAALYAIHRQSLEIPHKSGRSFANACIDLGKPAKRDKDGRETPHGFEMRFKRMIIADNLEELVLPLHRATQMMGRERQAFDYARLLKDLWKWKDYPTHSAAYQERGWPDVKTRWAQDFWQAPAAAQLTDPITEPA